MNIAAAQVTEPITIITQVVQISSLPGVFYLLDPFLADLVMHNRSLQVRFLCHYNFFQYGVFSGSSLAWVHFPGMNS